ncbi:MAG: LPS-assembly lipoprotein [Brevundimonas sp.]|jgi:LPS-assembly lipoprotein|uniref:LPS assembly lipoprotein LptE n=1 Tax=Brevundimonas sp. TaxID=1871086 RepID=UPI002487F3FF|nr:LPS assembly lipoprotein LptE [Brevundimonas sp.]MDI1280295.1 LPS assembly lipoprotein LptE [Brevundimonas sp.]
MRTPSALLALGSLLALGLSGCGFTPLYGDAGVGSGLSRIAVSTPDTRLGYRLREQLDDALGHDTARPPLWRLETVVEQSRQPLGRRIDDTATRYELTVRGAWTLTPVTGGTPVGGVEVVTTTYAAADQPYAAIAAQQDGEDRAAAVLARRIRLNLLRALSGTPPQP